MSKRLLDITCAIALAAIFAPLMGAIAIMLWGRGGAVLYRHRRIGRDGVLFDCLKFRTMIPDAEAALREILERHPHLKNEWLQDYKLREDPRVTGIGKFLRRTSLDELPQLWNVLKGEMSLVGPRPIVQEELSRYGRGVWALLSTRPGLTGLWQASGRNDTNYERRVALDVYYARKQTLLLDVLILAKTIGVVLGGTGAY